MWLCTLPQTGFKLTQAKKLEFNPNLNNGSGKNNEFSSRENSPAQQSDKATAQVSIFYIMSKLLFYKSTTAFVLLPLAISPYIYRLIKKNILHCNVSQVQR